MSQFGITDGILSPDWVVNFADTGKKMSKQDQINELKKTISKLEYAQHQLEGKLSALKYNYDILKALVGHVPYKIVWKSSCSDVQEAIDAGYQLAGSTDLSTEIWVKKS